MFKSILSIVILASLVACGKPSKHGGFTPGTSGLIGGGGGMTNSPGVPNDGGENAPGPNTPNGGEDLGGGDTKGSNDKFIEKILNDKIRLKKELEDILRNFDPREAYLSNDLAFVLKWNSKYYASKLDLAKVIDHIHLEDVCIDKEGELKSASVKEFKITSDICVSKKALAEIPSESLRKQIHLLLLHEISHLIGFLESDAQKMQDIALALYGNLFPDNSKTALKEIFIKQVVASKTFLKEITSRPDKYFQDGTILKDNEFFKNYSLKSHLIFPPLIKSAIALATNLENQSQENADLNTEKIQSDLTKVQMLPYALSAIFGDLTIARSKLPEVKNGDYLFVKKEFKKALETLENIDFIKNELSKAFWEYEEQRIAQMNAQSPLPTAKPLAP